MSKINIRKRNNYYEYRFEIASINGQRKWISKSGFKDQITARKEGLKAINEYNTCGQVIAPSTMSFADFLEHWIVNDCEASHNESTIANYRKKIKNLIVPCLGKYRINTIDRDKLQGLLMTLHDNRYASNTLSVVKEIITKCFSYALYSGFLPRSPAIKLKIPKNKNTAVPTRFSPHVFLNLEQINKIFNRFPVDTSAHLPLKIGLHCGLRLGEAFALTWDDIDLDKKKIFVNKQIQWRQFKRTKEEKELTNGKKTVNSGRWYFAPPKYKSDRIIEIDDELSELLFEEREKQEKAKDYFGNRYVRYYENEKKEIVVYETKKEVRFVFVREDGSYVTPRTMQHISRIIHNALCIKDFDYHSLRHTHATFLLEKGAPLKYIQQRL